jgi:hypothetical protein
MMRRLPLVAAATAAVALPGAVIAATQPAVPGAPTGQPVAVKSAFKADRQSSLPLGLTPDDVTRPFAYPDQPIVLSWAAVPGAKTYRVDVSSNPGFTDVDWSAETDQTQIAPDILFPDGSVWWRVTATDAAGVVGITSTPARFAKSWSAKITGLKVASTPGGAAVSQLELQPYFTWNALPGATAYDVEVAPGDQFAAPAFTATRMPAPFVTPGTLGLLPDDTYQWRVRGRDAKGNPGPWSTPGQFIKAWVRATPRLPDDGATVANLRFSWDPVPGAERYEIQVTDLQYNFVGNNLKINSQTANATFVPTLQDHKAKNLSYGDLWWRVRPVVNGILGGWSIVRHINYQPPASTTPTAVLDATADTDTALMPELSWTPVTGASIYRVDIATDPAFNNMVESQVTPNTSWVPRSSLPDNQTGTGYYWRVIWGTGTTVEAPGWSIDEDVAPKGTFKKQTRIVLGLADEAQVSESPLLSWTSVLGAPQYELQVSQNPQFDATSGGAPVTIVKTWSLGEVIGTHESGAKRLADGTWYWRVRPLTGGMGQTWSPVRKFTLTSPRPAVSAPGDGETVVGAPLMTWAPVAHACGYEVQVGKEPALGDGGATASTAQTALVLSSQTITEPGRWYWRVRANRCDDIRGPWSPTRSFKSVLPPDFGLNNVPSRVGYGGKTVVAGALSFGGARVKSPTLVLERRVWPDREFGFFGTVKGDVQGRFAFRLKNTRTAAYRLLWKADDTHPEGQAPFAIQVQPRVSFSVAGRKVVRRGRVTVRGSVYPARAAYIQSKTSGGWETIRTLRLRNPRFAFSLKATLIPGRHRLRVLVPGDQRLATARSKARPLFVYDKFVIKAGKGK